ncbi:MAG: hypothetical protein ACM31L_15525 [Actinomycetota bacterium]
MFFGRLVGWLLLVVAVIMASADAVLALGPMEYAGIVTADVVTLLSGRAPEVDGGFSAVDAIGSAVLALPAWSVVGATGLALLMGFRKRPRKRFVFRSR